MFLRVIEISPTKIEIKPEENINKYFTPKQQEILSRQIEQLELTSDIEALTEKIMTQKYVHEARVANRDGYLGWYRKTNGVSR